MTALETSVTAWWWIRHAPVQGHEGIYLGRLNPPANLTHREGLERLVPLLPAEAVWMTTPLARAHQTTDALAAACGVPRTAVIVETALIEQDFGQWQGRDYDSVYAETGREGWESPGTIRPPGGESFADMMPRVARCVAASSTRLPGRSVVAIAHAGTIRAALAHALDLTPDQALRFQIDPLRITRIDCIADGARTRWRLPCVNR